MKELVFVGKDNQINKDTMEVLAEKFQVEECDTLDAFRVRIQLSTPEMIVISLGEDTVEEAKIMNLLNKDFINIPVVTIGTEYELLPYSRYYETTQFTKVPRPVSDRELLELCCSILSVQMEEVPVEEKKHILVVDDNALILRNIKKMLSHKYSVAVAVSAVQALTSIGKKKPDLILLDYAMPVTDGKRMVEMLQADVQLARIPVVFLTSMADEKVVMELLALKPAGYFLKPPQQDKLLETIEAII